MTMSDPETNWPFVVNLANSIIGVAVLAFPLCFKQCGVILGLLLLFGCAWLAYTSCCLLAKAAAATKKRSYEYLAFHVFGPSGKLVVEICSAGLLIGTLIAFFVIVGDICPEILSEVLDIQNTTQLRTTVLITLGLLVILPLCMKSNLESISNLSIMSLLFYCLFSLRVIFSSLHHISTGEFLTDVKYWDSSGVFRSLPIFAVSYACQIQLFLVYHSTPEVSIKQIGGLVWRAIMLSSTIYFSVGYFGYLAFYDREVSGDIMMNYETTLSTGLIKLGFVSSTILSFPLVVYPCRCSLYTLISSKNLFENLGGTIHIPANPFKYLTCFIVALTLMLGILVPKVEFVLGLMGSTMGSIVCFILPGIIFLKVVPRETPLNNFIARAVLALGLLILVVSTWSTLHNADMETDLVDLEKDPQLEVKGFDAGGNQEISRLPITAPSGGIKDLGDRGAVINSSQGNALGNHSDGKAKVVHSNLAIDVANEIDLGNAHGIGDGVGKEEPNDSLHPKGSDEPDLGTNEKVEINTSQSDKADQVPDDNALNFKPPPKTPQSLKDEQPEKANMKKLLNLPKLENDKHPDDENANLDMETPDSQQKPLSTILTIEIPEVKQDSATSENKMNGVIVKTIMSGITDKHKAAKNKTEQYSKVNPL